MPMRYRKLSQGRTRSPRRTDDDAVASQALERARRASRTPAARKVVPAAAAKAAKRTLQRRTKLDGGLEADVRKLVVGKAGELHRGGRSTTVAPTASDVAELLKAAKGVKLSSRRVTQLMGPREAARVLALALLRNAGSDF